MKKPAASVLAGAVFTAVVQSSAATVGIANARTLSAAGGEEIKATLTELHETVITSVELTVQASRDADQRTAESTMMAKESVRDQSERRLARGPAGSAPTILNT